MSEFDSLEQELRRLRPRELSIEAQVRIEDRLCRAQRPPSLRILALNMLVACGIVFLLSCLAVVLVLRQRVQTDDRIGAPTPLEQAEVVRSIPTLAAYRQAFATSPEAFEELLDAPASAYRHEAPVRWGQALHVHPESLF